MHTLTPLINKNRKDKVKKKNTKPPESEDFQYVINESNNPSAQMYLTYSDAVLATLNQNVGADGAKLADLIEKLQQHFYFDNRTQEYVHPHIIPDSHLEFIIQNNMPIAKRFEVRDGLVYAKWLIYIFFCFTSVFHYKKFVFNWYRFLISFIASILSTLI